MYPEEKAELSPVKIPYHFEIAEKILNEFANMNSNEQVEAFKHIQKHLADTRVNQTESMQKEHEAYAVKIKQHIEGTNTIVSSM